MSSRLAAVIGAGMKPRWLPGAVAVALLVVLALAHASPARAGYTHYWTWKSAPEAGALESCAADMRRLMDASRGVIATGEAACYAPEEACSICFNGRGDQEHESFCFPHVYREGDSENYTPIGEMNFVKTQWKDYDPVVTACLIAARDHFPPEQLVIQSDGRWVDWWDGALLYERVLGRTARSPLQELAEDGDGAGDGSDDSPGAPGAGGSLGKILVVGAMILGALVVLVLKILRKL